MILSALCLTMIGVLADPWHLPDWKARAVVEIPRPSADPGVDTAAVRVLCQGRGKPDGSDYRVIDATGKPVPFLLAFHDGARYSLIAFRVADAHQRHFIYFANPQAERAAEQVVIDSTPGAGPPKGDWIPRHGLVFETMKRPEGENPKTVEEMAKLIAASPARFGARYQRRISDGYDPFGPSDDYISAYRGWLQIPKAGTYQFCTASNEASFSFLDGKTLVHWPGRHTAERGMRGEKNAAVELTAGPHYVEYFQEEVKLEQMAFLGWRPSADAGQFDAIPESIFTAPHEASVVSYEDPKGPLPHFEPIILDSVWPTDRHEGQYTRCRFSAGKMAEGTACHWDFGDGQKANGAEVDHVYLATGSYQVTLTIEGASAASWPLDVFEIENVTDQFKEGSLADYARVARTYDRNTIDAASLKELVYLLAESDDPTDAIEAGKVFVARFGAAKPEMAPRVRRVMAESSIRLGKEGLDETIANYRASITPETPTVEKLDVLARLIRLVGIEREMPEKAGAILGQVEETMHGAKADEATIAAYRRAVIAAGDVLLWHGKIDGAWDLYHRAETVAGQFIPAEVRSARIGSYPNAIRDFIETGNYGAALDLVDQWDEAFPTEKPKGQTYFWRGKLLALRGQDREAARHLARAIGLAEGSSFESEARWLLADSLKKIGKPDESRRELAKLVASGLDDQFAKKAREALEAKKP